MSAAALIEELMREGVTIRIEDSDLVVKGPATVLTPEVLATLRQQKPAILAYLQSDDGPLYTMHLGSCPALDGGRCNCRPILVSRRQAREWGWSV